MCLFSVLDRKKDLVKLQAGEYVSLGKVEAELKTCAVVDNICVYGDSSKQFTVALVVPNPKNLEELALKQGVTGYELALCTSPVMEKAVVKELAEHAKKCMFISADLFLVSSNFKSFLQANCKGLKCRPLSHCARTSGHLNGRNTQQEAQYKQLLIESFKITEKYKIKQHNKNFFQFLITGTYYISLRIVFFVYFYILYLYIFLHSCM